MRCFVASGPTWEPVDQVRRLTNFSTGSLGGRLANRLAEEGWDTTLLLSESAVWRAPLAAVRTETFSTASSLRDAWKRHSVRGPAALFQVAAVGDFTGAGLFRETGTGSMARCAEGKPATAAGRLWLALEPTPKILPQLRDLFPDAVIFGWKYEVDGGVEGAIAAARRQLANAKSNYCVLNGPAAGPGFSIWGSSGVVAEAPDVDVLLETLVKVTRTAGAPM